MADTDASLFATDWEDLLLAWLHDPFDKALRVQGHESRAGRYAKAALGRDVSRKGLHHLAAHADVAAAIAERLPAPTAGADGGRAVGPADGLRLAHPASGAWTELRPSSVEPDQDSAVAIIERIVDGLPDPRARFLGLWRLLPDRIADAFGDDMARLPADTRIPDHTLFQHVDITAGLHAAGAPDNVACLSFALGPVQPFIRAARSVRDLWSGSALLSWLAFQAMTPVIERLGPTAFVYPALRGSPLVDLWLRRAAGLGDRVSMPSRQARMAPSLPHRFVALVPWGPKGAAADALRRTCLHAARAGWRQAAAAVRSGLDPAFVPLHRDWARRWERQIESALEVRAAVAPMGAPGGRPAGEPSDDRIARLVGVSDFASAWPEAQRVRELALAIPPAHRPNYDQQNAGRWQVRMEMSARLLAAVRAVRHVPVTSQPDPGPAPAKCTLFGSWEQMGPAAFDEAQDFWRRASSSVSVAGVRLRPRERLSAIALTKRFAGPALLAPELDLAPEALRFPDTATVAAADWLHTAGIDPDEERRRSGHWSGLWLHWHRRDEVEDERSVPEALWERIRDARTRHEWPPLYFAVVALDGDEMGRWLAGQKTPPVGRLLHPKLRMYFEGLGDSRVEPGLAARRPVGPALHGAISSALSTFATEVAPEIVAAHHGTVIYSGGDDVLALCPVSTALDCVRTLRDAFSGRDDPDGDGWRACGVRRRITMGSCASMSAGVAIVHFREDLRLAIEAARDAETRAKGAGRDLLDLITMRRSGETARVVCPWLFVPWLDGLRQRFATGASDRWTYQLRSELPALASDRLPREAMQAEIRRLIDRSGTESAGVATPETEALESAEGSSKRGIGSRPSAGAKVAGAFKTWCELRHGTVDPLRDFVTLCQSASFMARGRDD